MRDFSEKKFIGFEEQSQITKNVESNVQEMQNLKSKNSPEICGVHIPARKTSDNSLQEKQRKIQYSQSASQDGVPIPKNSNNFQKQAQEMTDKQKCQDTVNPPLVLKGMEETRGENTNNMTDMDSNTPKTHFNISKPLGSSLNNNVKDDGERISVLNNDSGVINLSDAFVEASDNRSETQKSRNPNQVKSSPPLPGICSTGPVPSNPKTINNGTSIINDKPSESPLLDKTSPPGEKFIKSKVSLSQSPFISHSINSDSSSHDAEVTNELKSLTNLQSLRANQSIYKLAYDESITDQSEADSRSPSPVDPDTQVPKSIVNDEILIHEADSCSDAGSEDVELIPHRYESETFLNGSKHLYVNKLSLAVELLRTQESLPYDEQFKRVPRGNNDAEAIGEVNLAFIDESSSVEGLKGEMITQANNNLGSSGAVSSFAFEDGSCEEAKEVVVEAANTRICTMCSVS